MPDLDNILLMDIDITCNVCNLKFIILSKALAHLEDEHQIKASKQDLIIFLSKKLKSQVKT